MISSLSHQLCFAFTVVPHEGQGAETLPTLILKTSPQLGQETGSPSSPDPIPPITAFRSSALSFLIVLSASDRIMCSPPSCPFYRIIVSQEPSHNCHTIFFTLFTRNNLCNFSIFLLYVFSATISESAQSSSAPGSASGFIQSLILSSGIMSGIRS